MKYFFPVLIISLTVVILFGAHWLAYKFIVNFLLWDSLRIKKILVVSFALLSAAFIFASIAARFADGFGTRIFYSISGAWYGVMVNLLLAAAFSWLIYFLLKLFLAAPDKRLIGIIMSGLAAVFSIYGIWNAQILNVKNLEISIKNLPAGWAGKTAVHISDAHLGAVYGTNYLGKIINQINKINPDIIFITGDYFDGTCPNLERLVKPLDNLNPPLGIYFVYGNHETYEGKEKVAAALANSKAKLLTDNIVDINGLKIIGLDYIGEGLKRDTAIFKQINGNDANILLYHQPTLVKEAAASGIDLQLSGHAHRGQLFPISFIDKLIYGKYYYGLHQEGDYTIYAASGTGTWGPPMRTSGRNEIVAIKFIKK